MSQCVFVLTIHINKCHNQRQTSKQLEYLTPLCNQISVICPFEHLILNYAVYYSFERMERALKSIWCITNYVYSFKTLNVFKRKDKQYQDSETLVWQWNALLDGLKNMNADNALHVKSTKILRKTFKNNSRCYVLSIQTFGTLRTPNLVLPNFCPI